MPSADVSIDALMKLSVVTVAFSIEYSEMTVDELKKLFKTLEVAISKTSPEGEKHSVTYPNGVLVECHAFQSRATGRRYVKQAIWRFKTPRTDGVVFVRMLNDAKFIGVQHSQGEREYAYEAYVQRCAE
jgi:hypothetical protein